MGEASLTLYRAAVVQTGRLVEELARKGMLVLFNSDAPIMLGEYCVLHEPARASLDWKVGDHISLGARAYDITAVGGLAVQHLNDLGHITVRFDGAADPQLPGCVHVQGGGLYVPQRGEEIRIYR